MTGVPERGPVIRGIDALDFVPLPSLAQVTSVLSRHGEVDVHPEPVVPRKVADERVVTGT